MCSLITHCAFCPNGSLVLFDQRFADRQPETQTTELRSVTLFERIEDLWQSLGLNSKSGVGNLYMELFVRIIARRDMNLPGVGGKLHRVVDQVPKDLLQSRRIRAEMNLLRGQIQSEC